MSKKVLFISAVVILFAAAALLSLQQGGQPRVYGSAIEEGKYLEIHLSSINDSPEEYVGKNILLEGRIGQVCGSSGCWILINDGPYQLFVQFYDFTVNVSPGVRVQTWGELRQKQDGPYLAGHGMKVVR